MKHARNNFDALRLIGALLVLVSHQYAIQGRLDPTLWVVTLGQGALAMFFGMSGYLVTESWFNDPNIFRFVARRLLRVWPGFALMVVVLWAACTYLPHEGIDQFKYPVAGELFLSNLSLVTHWDWDFFPLNPISFLNGSIWTIQIEVLCYGVIGLALFLLGKHCRWLVVPALLACVGFSVNWANVLGACFLAGCAMRMLPRIAPFAIAAAIAFGLLIGARVVAELLCVVPLAIYVGKQAWWTNAARFGDLSYGVYLWAWPIGQVGVLLWGKDQPLLIFWTLGAIPVAWLSWHLIESQALKLKPRRTEPRRKVDAALPVALVVHSAEA